MHLILKASNFKPLGFDHRRVPKMPHALSDVAELSSDGTTETHEPIFRVSTRGGSFADVIYDLTTVSDSEDHSDIEIIRTVCHSPTVFSHPPSVPSKRKSSGTAERLCGERVPSKKSKLTHHTSGRRPLSVTIKGKVLKPTEVFDTFWYFAAERKAIDDKRRSGSPAP